MVNAIFCAHGKLACAMLESVQMVYGDARVEAVEFVPGENAFFFFKQKTAYEMAT